MVLAPRARPSEGYVGSIREPFLLDLVQLGPLGRERMQSGVNEAMSMQTLDVVSVFQFYKPFVRPWT